MENIKKLIVKLLYDDRVTYIIAGGCTTLVNIGSYAFLTWIAGDIPFQIRNVISISLAILFAFFANKIFVFRSRSENMKQSLKEFVTFVGGRLSTMFIEVGGMWLLFKVIGIDEMISKVAVQFVVLVVNYFISKFIVFRKH